MSKIIALTEARVEKRRSGKNLRGTANAADPDLARAQSLHQRGHIVEAEAAYDAIIAAHPEKAEAWAGRGVLDLERGRLASAASFTERAATLAPQEALHRARLGTIRKVERRYAEALQLFHHALTLSSSPSEGLWHEIGNIYFEIGDDTQAVAAYRKALDIAPNSSGTLNNLGNALCNLAAQSMAAETASEAVVAYRRALSIAPKFAGARDGLARALIERARSALSRGDGNGALAAVRDALRYRGQAKPKLMMAQRRELPMHRAANAPAPSFRNARVLAGERSWYVLSAENELYVDGMSNANPELEDYVRVSAANGGTILQLDAPRIEVSQGAFLLGGSRNYYHWMVDYFPRLRMPEATQPLPLLINDDLAPFQKDCFAQLRIPDERMLRVPMPSIIQTTELVAPPIACSEQKLHPSAANWLRDIFSATGSARARSRIYVSRRDSVSRRVVNEDEIVAALGKLDFEVVVPGELSVPEQARRFAEAAVIVGPHGSGLTNIIFAPANALVVELTTAGRQQPSFMRSLAAGLGLRFHSFAGWPLPTQQQRASAGAQDYDMVVPAAELARQVIGLGGGRDQVL
ncbi:MAG TPA: glycosyltransferase 61 family protein [Stellaceae bacterium]|nr:glycosyltransferase 61 family protein [Stellaceae bacterium]